MTQDRTSPHERIEPSSEAEAPASAQLALARADAALIALAAIFELLQGDQQLLKLFDDRAAAAASHLKTVAAAPPVVREFEAQIALLRSRLTHAAGPNPMDVAPLA